MKDLAEEGINPKQALEDRRNYDWPTGFGAAFVEFEKVEEAIRARRGIHLLRYGEDTKKHKKAELVECSYLGEREYRAYDFGNDVRHKTSDLAQLFNEFKIAGE